MEYKNLDTSWDWSNIKVTILKPEGLTREQICEIFHKKILDYYGVEHEVDFEKIKRDWKCPGIELYYKYDQKYKVDSLPDKFHKLLTDYEDSRPESIIIANAPTLEEIRDRDALANIYSDMTNGNSKEADKEAWAFVKYFIWQKIKGLFRKSKDGNYWEVQHVNYKIEKLHTFNEPKRKFIETHLKKSGKTLENFRQASTLWDLKNKEKLNISKYSMELKADLATSGLNDKVF